MMVRVSSEEYLQLVHRSELIESDHYGEKVLRSRNGQMIKIFRRKRLFSSALWLPYAKRFARNAQRLARLEIPTVRVVKLGRCQQPRRDLVWYQPIAGQTLRAYCQQRDLHDVLAALADFIALLHQRGVLFRSLHWGNIIVTEDLSLGLIDIADMRFYRRPLNITQRERNFRHLLRYAIDRTFFVRRAESFWNRYQVAAGLSDYSCQTLQGMLHKNFLSYL